ncbi:MAG: tRNA (adenosine(37)-N6)-threonylcarbamoyltransferase complex dimerization subunit type 1 TsaB [Bacilli bacterium]|nr:tRNA (adenosine(37)-N6)-threonylcarbamoyltransferase complex dimerization subunit type 1 TsaB [Bacilli bacterium]
MRYLYIDTSSSYLYSGIVEDNKLIAEIKEEFGQSLSEVALPKIVSLFEKNNLTAKDIDKIIVVNGPGSFTGIRIGITIAKVYAWSLNIPITTITSLEAMAISSKNNKVHIPIINARRGYVFAAIIDKNYNFILKPKHLKLEELLKNIKNIDNFEIITNDQFEELKNTETFNPDILKIVTTFKDKENINPHAVNPDYLKLTEAEESKL